MTDPRVGSASIGRTAPDRALDAARARQYLEAPITDAERDEILALIRWFRRRYPTPADRLAYVRRAYARWRRTLGIASVVANAARRGT